MRKFAFLLIFCLGVSFAQAASLQIGNLTAMPGSDIFIPVELSNEDNVGGFEILIGTDPASLIFQECIFTARDDFGHEYNQIVDGDAGPGTVRIEYMANIDNGQPHGPIPAGSGGIFYLRFNVNSSLPYGMQIPVNFITDDFTDNALFDENGGFLEHPDLVAGSVIIGDFESDYGDLNLNGTPFDMGDLVLMARRLIRGYEVWTINPVVQEIMADVNNNGFVDIADLYIFMAHYY